MGKTGVEFRGMSISDPSTGKPIVSLSRSDGVITKGISPPVVCGEIVATSVVGVPPGCRTLIGEMVVCDPDPEFEVFNRPSALAPPSAIPAWLSAYVGKK